VFQPRIVEVKKLVAPRGVSLCSMWLEFLEGLDGGVEASGARRLDRAVTSCQPSLHSGEEV
jgi:hypothetical protein